MDSTILTGGLMHRFSGNDPLLINRDVHENDKIIMNMLGRNADTPLSELLKRTKYKRKSSVYKRIRNLREEEYLFGPYFDINYNVIGKNKLFSVFVFADYNLHVKELVLEAMKTINCWTMIYPVRTAESYIGIYQVNNWNYIASLFNLMKKWGWLKSYSVHKSEHRRLIQNPNFFGDFLPPPDYCIPDEEYPPYSYEDVETDFKFSKIDLIIIKHLSRQTCHLSRIRDLEYQYYGLKLKYQDLKSSYEKLETSGVLIKKIYLMFPLPANMCTFFFLYSKGKNLESHLRMIANFGKDLRLTKTVTVFGKEVITYFSAHPLLEGKILGLLENTDIYANVYGIKSYPSTELLVQTFNDDYFDVDNQRWVFPYLEFKEEINELKEKKEKEGIIS